MIVRRAAEEDIPFIAAAAQAQTARWRALDPRIAAHTSHAVEEGVRTDLSDVTASALVVKHAEESILGYAAVRLWEISADDSMLAFCASRTGTSRTLVLPDPTAPDATAAASALLDALETEWSERDTIDDLIVWPSLDPGPGNWFRARGFADEYVTALRERGPLVEGRRPPPAGLTIRPSEPGDEESLIELFWEEMDFHTPFSRLQRLVPAMETDFRAKQARAWHGANPDAQIPLTLVAVIGGEVVGWTENFIRTGSANEIAPSGTSGYLRSVGVTEVWRGQGVGRRLVAATLDALQALGAERFTLSFTPANPISSRFWPAMGFHPLTTGYQRRKATDPIAAG